MVDRELIIVLMPHDLWCAQAGAAAVPAFKWASKVCSGCGRGSRHAWSPLVPSHGAGSQEPRKRSAEAADRAEGTIASSATYAMIRVLASTPPTRAAAARSIAVEFELRIILGTP